MMNRFLLGLSALLSVAFLTFSCTDGGQASFTRVDPFDKLLPETSWSPAYSEVEEVAAGECATFQYALRSGSTLQDVRLSFDAPEDGSGHTLESVKVGFIDYVHVGRTVPNPGRDIIKSPSGMFPDPIVDDAPSRDIPASKTQPVWVTVSVPKDAVPGVYKGKVRVKGKGVNLSGEIAVKVYPVVLEEPTLWVTNWYSSGEMALKHFNPDAELYSEEHWDFIRALAGKMKESYQNTIRVSLSTIESKADGDKWSFDFTKFDKEVELFQEAGVLKRLAAGQIGGRIGLWNSPFGVTVPGVDEKLPIVARNYYSQFIPAFVSHLKEKGWYSIYCQHIADEPAKDNCESYVAISRFFKSLAPDVPIIEACHSHDLADIVDIWVPKLSFLADGYPFYKERQEAGDEVWFYTSMTPQGNYSNRFIELPLLKVRLMHWINFRYGATGYLHWGLNRWGEDDPWDETTGINTESGNVLPGGDSWIIYPGDRKLYGSIRFEAMRDGIADYTLLQMLARKDEAKARELCRQMVYGWETYDMSTIHFRKARHEILEALASPLKFAVASDFHALDTPDGGERIKAFVKAARDEEVDFIIELGDYCRLTDGCQAYQDLWNGFEGDRYHVLGNHDMEMNTKDEYIDAMGMPGRYYSFDKGAFHFIVLDGNNLFDGSEYRHYSKGNFFTDSQKQNFVDPEQLDWLEKDLSATDRKCILFSHESIDMEMNNGDKVRQILEDANKQAGFKKVVMAFSGHDHSNYTKEINGITYMQVNSASYVWIGEPTRTEERYPAEINDRYHLMKYSIPYDKPLYAIVTLTDDGAEVKGTRADFLPPTPKDLGMKDSLGRFPLVSVIEDKTVSFTSK